MKIDSVSIESLSADPANARKHSKKNLEAIKGSLQKFGQQKPIVVDGNNIVVAGNGTLEAAKSLGWTEIEIVRTNLTGPEAIAFALADNRTAELAEWDIEPLTKTLQSLKDIDFDLGSIGFDDDFTSDFFQAHKDGTAPNEQGDYSTKVESPVYRPTGPKPSLKECLDNSKTYNLIEEIDKATIPADEKEFLRWAAYRHAVFNYQNIAEYYAQSSPAVQALMEKSALVIIDFDKAIENGFVVLSKELAEAFVDEQ